MRTGRIAVNTSLQFRRYDRRGWHHHHDHVQVVLAARGVLEIEVDGRGGRVEPAQVAFIAPGIGHDQSADGDERFLLLNCAEGLLDERRIEQLRQRPFLPAGPRLRRLAAFLDWRWPSQDLVPDGLLRHCLPSLLAELEVDPAPLQRLQSLCDAVRARPGEPWPVARMASSAGMGASRLHALFRQCFDQSPQQWLAALRLQRACAQLAGGQWPIARIAFDNGWSDQTALTRSLRRATGLTPAAYRRRHGG